MLGRCDKGREIMENEKECCGNCEYHKVIRQDTFCCNNHESDYYGDYTNYEDSCPFWNER